MGLSSLERLLYSMKNTRGFLRVVTITLFIHGYVSPIVAALMNFSIHPGLLDSIRNEERALTMLVVWGLLAFVFGMVCAWEIIESKKMIQKFLLFGRALLVILLSVPSVLMNCNVY